MDSNWIASYEAIYRLESKVYKKRSEPLMGSGRFYFVLAVKKVSFMLPPDIYSSKALLSFTRSILP